MINKSRQPQPQPQQTYTFTFEELNLIESIQALWIQYVMWERSLLLAQAFKSPDFSAVQNRVYRIPMEFYNTLRIFYGNTLAQQFLNYIQRRLIIERDLMNGFLTNDQNAVNSATQQLYENADEIASFLGQTPYWEESQWKTFLYQDISLFISEAIAVLSGEYEREIGIYESILNNASEIGRYMAFGLIESSRNATQKSTI